jgi:hypothetical protein
MWCSIVKIVLFALPLVCFHSEGLDPYEVAREQIRSFGEERLRTLDPVAYMQDNGMLVFQSFSEEQEHMLKSSPCTSLRKSCREGFAAVVLCPFSKETS